MSYWNYLVSVTLLACTHVVSSHCIQLVWSEKSDMIVWLLGLVFANTEKVTLAVMFMPSQWLQNPECWQCCLAVFDWGATCMSFMTCLFTFHNLFMEHPLRRKKEVFSSEFKVFCCFMLFTANFPKLKLKLDKEC